MKASIIAILCICSAFALGPYPIDPRQVSVGGISAGGFFAVQYQVAFSSEIIGAGIFAGGPYYCAQANEGYAFTECMYGFISIPISTLVSLTQSWASAGNVDPVKYLTTHRTFMYSGTEDTVVSPTVVEALAAYYQQIGIPSANISTEFTIPSEHCQPTNDYGNSCSYLGSPYIDNCNYDGAGTALQWIYGKLNQPTTPNNNNYFTFAQSAFTPNGVSPSSISLGDTGYIYVPKACQNSTGEKNCKLHIVFHGCAQTIEDIGEAFVQNSGYSKWAEANNIVVLYPQATANMLLGNPNGCFDWWGYTSLLQPTYAQKAGAQMTTVYNMVQAVLGTSK